MYKREGFDRLINGQFCGEKNFPINNEGIINEEEFKNYVSAWKLH